MRRLRMVGAAMAVILTGVVIGGLSSTSVAQTQVQVLEFPGPYARDVDLAKTGFGPGDMHVEISDLLDPVDESVLGGRS
ncbi:MAG: hypothetical protein ACRDI1_08720 [Actinomycetota bacterium]